MGGFCVKKGITFLSIMVAVVALAIITATLVISVPNVIQSSKLRTFATELMEVQLKVQSLNGNYSEYIINDIVVDISDLTDKSMFEGIITDNKVSLQQLNIEALGLNQTVYGNSKTSKDIYCVSSENNVVYYLEGFETPDAKYYALNSDLMNMVSSKEDLTDNVGTNIVFIPSTYVKTSEAITLTVKVPVAATGVNITTSGNVTPTVSGVTIGTNYNQYTVNTNSVKGNYTVTVKYTLNGENKTATYNVEEYLGVYGILYSDGELRINNDGKVDKYKLEAGNTVTFQSADIANSSSVPWSTYATSIKTVTFENDVVPAYITKWFQGCTNLIEINNTEYLDTSKVTNMSYLFYNCKNLKTVDVSGFNTSNVTNMAHMFRVCNSLDEIDVKCWDTSKVTTMESMFRECTALKELDLSSFNSPKLANVVNMFKDSSNIEVLNLTGFKTPKTVGFGQTFQGLSKVKELDLSGITKISSMYQAFNNCAALNQLDLSHVTFSGTINFTQAFANCRNMTILDLPDAVIKIGNSLQQTFANCNNLTYVNVSKWDTSLTQTMRGLFQECYKLNNIDVSNWNTSAVTIMDYAFMNCKALEDINLINWDTSSVTSLNQMFQNCTALKELDLSTWETSNLKATNQMFLGCTALSYLDIRKASFDQVTNSSSMFAYVISKGTIVVADDTAKTWVSSLLQSNSQMVVKKVSEL